LSTVVIFLSITFGLCFYYLDKADNTQDEQEKLDYFWRASLFFPALERYDSFSAFLMSKKLPNMSGASRKVAADYALLQLETAIAKMPFNTRNYVVKASILQATQADINAVSAQYEKALHNKPVALRVRYRYAQYLAANGQATKALKVLWGHWGRVGMGFYRDALAFLNYQLALSKQLGTEKETTLIAQEIQRFEQLQTKNKGGVYVFTK